MYKEKGFKIALAIERIHLGEVVQNSQSLYKLIGSEIYRKKVGRGFRWEKYYSGTVGEFRRRRVRSSFKLV